MELKIDISFGELLFAIKQLPDSQQTILKKELSKKTDTAVDNTNLKELLLKGPVMSDEQYATYKETRKQINQWRTK